MKRVFAVFVCLVVFAAPAMAANTLDKNLDIIESYINNPRSVSQDSALRAFRWVRDYIGSQDGTFVVNAGTGKFHRPSCRYADGIAEEKRLVINGTRDDMVERGYEPCKVCNP